ncbi:hypothetical protein CQ018_12385 [Arthrobacter sp. MYb227]|uniref:DUF726 domain-containing protein n=1 Tax=Arthrobacter sp. MYb227 TaxID=1848601 RepID=UPI000CFB4E77|nr:DUF726 domain-containing protein [Arthrobacter sp. MYb227]PQZ92295.1 hypothetical protein CQ018_12385 [Arthrobacter sp. MYb227]
MNTMQKAEIVARVLDGNSIHCRVVSPTGQVLELTGSTDSVTPNFEQSGLGTNRMLVNSAWAFALDRYAAVDLPDQQQQQQAENRAQKHRKMVEWLAEVSDELTDEKRYGWCSACFGQHEHRKVKRPLGQLPVYLCDECGSPTLPCAAPLCKNMAVRGRGSISIQRYCAEHRHETPGFAKASTPMGALNDYEEFLKYDKPNLARAVKVVGFAGAGLAAATPFAFLAAPAIGGAVGVVAGGFSGAAATSYGLALLGGGAIAAGGLGMAGGTAVVTGLGAALGGVLGSTIANAYVREDKSFHIEMLQGGSGVPVVVCNGFLSESGRGWGEWRNIITQRYPDSPVYRVHWGAKELKNLAYFGGGAAARVIGAPAVQQVAARAAKLAAKKLGPIAPALLVADLVKNPWHVAKIRAEKTGAILADLIARTTEDSFVLVGHSLGARAMVFAAQALNTKTDGPRIESMHLLGAAIGAKGDWKSLAEGVNGTVYNYHSTNDGVLKSIYPVAQAGQTAAGRSGFMPVVKGLKNVDVSEKVKAHSDYHEHVQLSLADVNVDESNRN